MKSVEVRKRERWGVKIMGERREGGAERCEAGNTEVAA
jgi:hypothetical protein